MTHIVIHFVIKYNVQRLAQGQMNNSVEECLTYQHMVNFFNWR